ncbi:hypothetical protein EYE40_14410 [Glaciihabitans arcticus]|uniref:Uncharacterized protein n=1 Tax=Glaciihabitans arcticus TaxID=2668039 RepID=A0A4Q9GT55_9MICO|nr:hypothetical protein [Glaciihabitans arcticus]TBN55400.1 hypothetical protein EYE40_14410 [Glaciihabitans arcticus]
MTIQFEETEVEPAKASWLPAILAVVGFGVVIGAAVLVYVLTFFGPTSDAGFCAEVLPSCATVSVERVEELAGVDLPEGATVVRAFSGERDGQIVLDAVLQLPEGAEPKLADSYPVTFEGTRIEVNRLSAGTIWTGGTDDGSLGYQLLVSEDEPRTVTIGISKAP